MQLLSMLINGSGGLGTAVAFAVIEIKGGYGMFAKNTLERDAAVQRPGRVITHGSL